MQNVVEILGFGFLGLAFLMLFLGYRLYRQLVNQPTPAPASIKLARFFLTISLVFMIVAGPLQFGLLFAQYIFVNKPVDIYVGMYPSSWDKGFGDVTMRRKGQAGTMSLVDESPRKATVSQADSVDIELSRVSDFIKLVRQQLNSCASPNAQSGLLNG